MMTRKEIINELYNLTDEEFRNIPNKQNVYGGLAFRVYGIIITIGERSLVADSLVDDAPFYMDSRHATDYGYLFYNYLQCIWAEQQDVVGQKRLECMLNAIKTVTIKDILIKVKERIRSYDIDSLQHKIEADPVSYIDGPHKDDNIDSYFLKHLLITWVKFYAKSCI